MAFSDQRRPTDDLVHPDMHPLAFQTCEDWPLQIQFSQGLLKNGMGSLVEGAEACIARLPAWLGLGTDPFSPKSW